jgi:hypothetical protein
MWVSFVAHGHHDATRMLCSAIRIAGGGADAAAVPTYEV